MDAAARPSAIACLECRQKHLKCDAKYPTCTRCTNQVLRCSYGTSKRGRKRAAILSSSGFTTSPRPPSYSPSDEGNLVLDVLHRGHNPVQSGLGQDMVDTISQQPEERDLLASRPFTKAYFTFFHPAHPMLPPLSTHVALPSVVASLILSIIDFVGSHYVVGCQGVCDQNPLVEKLFTSWSDSYVTVQAALLMTILLHFHNRQHDAVALLDRTTELAIQLGMHLAHYAPSQAQGSLILEESIRRTWWELYIVDTMLSAIHKRSSVRTHTVKATAWLPIEDSDFASGKPSAQLTLEQSIKRCFGFDDVYPSSFALRIEAASILGRGVALDSAHTFTNSDSDFVEVDALLTSWSHHLPHSKREILDHSGTIDEALFAAHMMIHTARIFMHLPRSNLQAAHSQQRHVECALKVPPAMSTTSPHTHAVVVIAAANELGRLASLPSTVVARHTPFWICSLVLGAVAHLSACCVSACACLKPHRHWIVQALGMLRTLSSYWPMAEYALSQVRGVVVDVMATGWKPTTEHGSCELDPANGGDLLREFAWGQTLESVLDMPTPSMEPV